MGKLKLEATLEESIETLWDWMQDITVTEGGIILNCLNRLTSNDDNIKSYLYSIREYDPAFFIENFSSIASPELRFRNSYVPLYKLYQELAKGKLLKKPVGKKVGLPTLCEYYKERWQSIDESHKFITDNKDQIITHLDNLMEGVGETFGAYVLSKLEEVIEWESNNSAVIKKNPPNHPFSRIIDRYIECVPLSGRIKCIKSLAHILPHLGEEKLNEWITQKLGKFDDIINNRSIKINGTEAALRRRNMPFLTVQIESNKGNQNLYEMFKEAGEVVDENERDLEVKISFNSFLEKFATAYGSLDRMGKLFVRHLKSEDDWEDQDHNDFKAAIREESLRPYCVYITTSNYGTEYDRSLIFYGSKEITDLLNTLPIKYKSKGTKSEKQAIERGGIAIKRNYDGVTMGGKTALEREVKRELRNRKERIFFIDKTDETYYSLGYRHKHSKKRFDKIGNL